MQEDTKRPTARAPAGLAARDRGAGTRFDFAAAEPAGNDDFRDYLEAISFSPPDQIVPSAWLTHAPFAFWLIEALRPRTVVELGTFRGFSYLAFCQAIERLGLDARCYAVDTWEGDEHSGPYGPDVLNDLRRIHDAKYSSFSTLIQSSFDDAAKHFADASIDLLHIDGCHRYETVRHDFEHWAPTLSPRAVVLFHDTNERQGNFGVFKLWDELKAGYPSFEFAHGHGLGVLGVGSDIPVKVRQLFAASANAALAMRIRATYSRLGAAIEDRFNSERQAGELAETLRELQKARATARAARDKAEGLEADANRGSQETIRLRVELDAARAREAQSNAALERRATELQRAGEEHASIQRRAAQLEAKLEIRRTELIRLADTLTSAQKDSAGLADALANAAQHRVDLEQALARAAQRKIELEAALAMSSAQAQRLARELEAVRARANELQHDLQNKLPPAVAERDRARERIAELEADAQSRDAEIASVRARVANLAAAVAAHDSELGVVKTSLSWRLTAPFRRTGRAFPRIEHLARIGAKFVWFTITLQLPSAIIRTIRRRRSREIISSMGGFQGDWYLAQHPDVRRSGLHPLVHYVAYGAAEGRDPNPLFDTNWYLAQNPDVRASVINPLVHYLKHGAAEGRDPSPLFDTDWYLATNPDVREAGLNPLAHYLEYGAAEGRVPLPLRTVRTRVARPVRSKYDVVIFANIDWNARWQRPQQLAQQFARNGHRVFYVVAYPNFPDSVARRYEAAAVADDIVQVRFSQSCFFDRYKTAVHGKPLAQILAGFDRLVEDFDIADALIHVHLASWTSLAIALREKWLWKIVYDCMDEWDGFPNIGAEILVAEKELVRVADGVTVTGPLLHDKWKSLARRCEVVRNGVDFPFFRENCRPNNRFSFRSPVIGYYGAIAEWLDLELLAKLAARHPEWQFVLAGDVFVSDLHGLDRMANVKLLGLRPHEDMPALLWHFDVCLIPFKLNAMTHAVDPVKLYEYLSGGKPVVSVPLKEVEIHRGIIACATGADEFARAISAALADRDPAHAAARQALAERNQWSDRYLRIDALVREICPVVSIVIVTYNNCDLTRLCVDSILAHTTYPSFEVILVDNNSTDDTKDYLRGLAARHASIKAILNADNRGFAGATNQGLEAARGDVLVILNNDVVVPRAWLRGMLRCLDDAAIGLVGPVTNSVGNEARIAVGYTQLDDMNDFARAHMTAHRAATFDITVLAMFCLAMRREAFERIGPLDEGFTIGMFEDDDYANRAREAGYRVVCTEESFVHHAGQAAFKKLIETGEYQAVWDRNQAYYESKWGNWKPHVHRAT